MSKIQALRNKSLVDFRDDGDKQKIAARGIDFLEEWVEENQFFDSGNYSRKELATKKRQCSKYIKDNLHRVKEEEFGILGTLIVAVIFHLIVTLIVRWIIRNFF